MLLRVDGCGAAIGPAGRDVVDGWELQSLSSGRNLVLTLRDGAPEYSSDHSVTLDETTEAALAGADAATAAVVVWLPAGGWACPPGRPGDAATGVWPVIRRIPGLLRLLVAVADRSVLALLLATSTRAIDDAARAIRRTPLPSDLDPTLLAAPDRIEFCAVTARIRAPFVAGSTR
jgi:hypothetical protein